MVWKSAPRWRRMEVWSLDLGAVLREVLRSFLKRASPVHSSVSPAETVGNVGRRQKSEKMMYLSARSKGLKNHDHEISFYTKM